MFQFNFAFSAFCSTFAGLFSKISSYRSLFIKISKLAWPITIGQLGLVLMGAADVIMLGHYRTLDMSSAGFGNAVFLLFVLLGVGTMFAVSTLTSIVDGEGNAQQAVPIFKSSILVALFLSALLMLLNLFIAENIAFFGQADEMAEMGREYLLIVNWSTPAMLLMNSGKQVMDGLGKTKAAMYVTFLGLLMNILFNYLLIFGKLGFSEMGLTGAAWATVISRYFMAIVMLIACWWSPLMAELKKRDIVQKSYFAEILRIGVPVGFTFFFEIAAFSVALIFAGQISVNHAAAHQIAIQLASITYMFVTGMAAAGNIAVGNHYGDNDPVGLRRAGLATLMLTIAIETLFALVFLLFNDELALLYNSDSAVLEIATPLIILAAFFQLSDGIQAVGAGILRGIKDTKVTSLIAFFSYWIVMTPGAWWLCFKTDCGINGIWISFIVGLSFAAVALVIRFNQQSKKLIRLSGAAQ